MNLNELPNDKVPEKNLKTLKLIRQQEDNLSNPDEHLLLQEGIKIAPIGVSVSDIQEQYNNKRKKLFTKHCSKCAHKCAISNYCNLKKEIIYDEELHAFCCNDYKKIGIE